MLYFCIVQCVSENPLTSSCSGELGSSSPSSDSSARLRTSTLSSDCFTGIGSSSSDCSEGLGSSSSDCSGELGSSSSDSSVGLGSSSSDCSAGRGSSSSDCSGELGSSSLSEEPLMDSLSLLRNKRQAEAFFVRSARQRFTVCVF